MALAHALLLIIALPAALRVAFNFQTPDEKDLEPPHPRLRGSCSSSIYISQDVDDVGFEPSSLEKGLFVPNVKCE